MRDLLLIGAACAALLVTPTTTWAGAGRARQTPAPVPLSAVVVSLDGPFVRITVRGSAALPPATATPTTEGPPRVFIDLPGVSPGAVPASLTGRAIVRRVRVALNSADPPVTRLVLDLAGAVTTAMVPGGSELTIVIAPADGMTAAAAPPAPAAEVRVPPPPPAPRVVPAPPVVPAPAVVPAPPVVPPPTVPAATTATASVVPPSAQPPTASMGGFGAPRAIRPNGRVSVYVSGAKTSQTDGPGYNYGDVMTAVSYELSDRESDGVEYGLDMRHAAYTVQGRAPRVSIYTGFVGTRLAGGALKARVGHLWLDDLGGLGAVAGAHVEGRSASTIPTTGLGRWRAGAFGGLEPNVYTFGYGESVRKVGAYGALEGGRGRRHVAGYVNIHNGAITERSVLTVTNFLPVGPVSVYQAAEYDLSPIAGGRGHDGLTYFFGNARVNVSRRLELLGTVSRGRSVDTRGLSDDIQAGRPVSQQSLDGLRYESMGARATVEVLPRVRVHAGYSRDKNNRDDASTGRWQLGAFAANTFGSGLDVTLSDNRTARPDGSYHSTYASLGRELGPRIYATAEYSTALSQVRFVRGDGLVIDSRPETKRAGINGSILLWRSTSLLVSVERTTGNDYKELRMLAGITVRMR
ncbi:MAG: AMIN domain-containing protein [Acidobacteria bacterium]|nr:AMIN domain-containing protein [Acidobacteriota bacterium]